MIGSQQVLPGAVINGRKHITPSTAAQAFKVRLANAKCVKNGGDTSGSNLCIVCQQGRQLCPLNFGSGHQVTLKVVGMNFN